MCYNMQCILWAAFAHVQFLGPKILVATVIDSKHSPAEGCMLKATCEK